MAASTYYCPPPAPVSLCLLGRGWPLDLQLFQDVLSVLTFASSAAALFGEAAPQVKSDRLRGLLDRQRALQEALSVKLQELRKVCLQEAVRAWPQGCHAGGGEEPGDLGRHTAVMGAQPLVSAFSSFWYIVCPQSLT